jgi:ABC-type uncharacterized transport system substrate-binding protein
VKRREFITLLGGAGVAWPLAASAQQRAMPVIGVLHTGRNDDRWQDFREGLRQTGLVEGQNVAIEYRFGDNNETQAQALAGELVRRQVAVIVTSPNQVAGRAAKAATTTIPIVFMCNPDPVRTGLVGNLNRPGGNLTGVTQLSSDLTAKRLGILRDVVPQATAVAILLGSSAMQADPDFQLREAQEAGRKVGLQVIGVEADDEGQFDIALGTAVREGAQALMVATAIYFLDRRQPLARLAARHRLPAIYTNRLYVEAGGLMSYAPNDRDLYRQVGEYAGRVLKATSPATCRSCCRPSSSS